MAIADQRQGNSVVYIGKCRKITHYSDSPTGSAYDIGCSVDWRAPWNSYE